MLSRRNLLKGLFAAPLVITTPGLLMPVKAIPVDNLFAMKIKGIWLDGSWFDIDIEHGYSAADIGGMDWFGMVKRIDSVEYTQAQMKQLVDNQSRIFDIGRRYDSQMGMPMVPYHMRPNRDDRGFFKPMSLDELKRQGFIKTPPEWQ